MPEVELVFITNQDELEAAVSYSSSNGRNGRVILKDISKVMKSV